MNQMKAPQAHVLESGPYGMIRAGSVFRRRVGEGEIYFAGRHGNWIYAFPVFENGTISNNSPDVLGMPEATEVVDCVDPSELGIA